MVDTFWTIVSDLTPDTDSVSSIKLINGVRQQLANDEMKLKWCVWWVSSEFNLLWVSGVLCVVNMCDGKVFVKNGNLLCIFAAIRFSPFSIDLHIIYLTEMNL